MVVIVIMFSLLNIPMVSPGGGLYDFSADIMDDFIIGDKEIYPQKHFHDRRFERISSCCSTLSTSVSINYTEFDDKIIEDFSINAWTPLRLTALGLVPPSIFSSELSKNLFKNGLNTNEIISERDKNA